MEITHFEIVDLGPGAEGSFDDWGPSFNPSFNSSAIGCGASAKDAFDDALNQLAFDGFGTKLLHECGIEQGLLSQHAHTPVEDIEPHVDGDEDAEGETDPEEPIFYHIGIRFEAEMEETAP